MKKLKTWMFAVVAITLVVTAFGVAAAIADSETPTSEAVQDSGGSGDSSSQALDGAKVYAWSCGSCHSERWPKERSDADWELITTHMRVRANLTADQAGAVLDYLQESN